MNTWNLTDYFKNEEEFYNLRTKCLENAKDFSKYKGKVLENINEVLLHFEQIDYDLSTVYTYASQKYHLDMKDSKNLEDYSQTMNVEAQINGLVSWLNPEIIKYDKEELLSKLSDENQKKFKHTLDKIYHNKKFLLSAEEENILVNLDKAREGIIDSYLALTISDNNPASVIIDNKEVLVTSSNYAKLLSEVKNQDDRRKIFEAYYDFYSKHSTTLAAMYNNVVSINSTIAKIRGFNSSLEAKLHQNDIPTDVYKALIDNVKKHTPFLKKFMKFRKEELGLESIHTYDRMYKVYSTDKQYPYEDGYNLVLEAAKSAGDEYHDLIKHVLQDGWIDVYPNDNKISGAYSWGTYSTHPYILHNYNGTLNSVYTLMHEAGHSLHTHLSKNNQTFFNSQYPIYLAEIASTFAECVLTDHLLENEKDESTKKSLIEENIIGVVATYYRQTLFADFEYQTHLIVDEGKSLTSEVLCNIMQELYLEYYDIDLNTEESKKMVWAYIPHLIKTPFYVYQYSTCITASFAIYNEYIKSKENGLNILFNILKAGGSDYPNKILLENNIDLSSDASYEAVLNYLEKQFSLLK